MTERERLPDRDADGEPDSLLGRVEEELREPIVEGRREDVPPETAERINWPVVIGIVATVAVVAAVIYALLITWSAT